METTLLLPALVTLLGGWLLLRRRRAFVVANPRYQELLRQHRLTDAGSFLDVVAAIVSGHPGRNVARFALGEGPCRVVMYLKREERVSWGIRLANAVAGFGFVSLSVRESQVLRSLPRLGIDGPEWVAAGEDERGRAFLLLREVPGAVELRSLLAEKQDAFQRQRLARALGAAVAKVHDAGFDHPDLYSKHLLVDPDYLGIVILDWQRSRGRRAISRTVRARDLAALNATVPADLADWRERLRCVQAYAEFLGWTAAETRGLARATLCHTARLLSHRHVREKGHLPATGQQWFPLKGGEVCVTPAFERLCPQQPPWLSLDHGLASAQPVARREVSLGNGHRGVLVRRRARSFWRAFWDRLRGRQTVSPEQRQAEVLLRLERYGVMVPSVLAMGRRAGRFGRLDSLLLIQPIADTVALAEWIGGEWDEGVRRSVLSEVGAVLRRLHEACCHLPDTDFRLALCHGADGSLHPVLTAADALLVTQAPSPSLVARNLSSFTHALRHWGATLKDVRWLLEGYTAAEEPVPACTGLEPGMARRGQGVLVHAGASNGPGGPSVAVMHGATTMPSVAAPRSATLTATPDLPWWRRLFRGGRRLAQRADWPAFAGADWADRIMDLEITDRFHAKQGRSTCRWVLHAPGSAGGDKRLAVYLKRHYRVSWWRGWLAALWPGGNWSPAFAEFDHLEWARAQGVLVPEVVAAAEYTGPWGRLQSVLAVEELTGMLPLHEAIPLAASRLDPDSFRAWKRGLIAEMARITRLLHDRRCFHKDLYLCHFYIARHDTAGLPTWRGRVFLIDLHRLGHHPWTWRLWQTKDLAQLLYSSEVPGIDARDRLFFWREYLSPGARGGCGWLRRYVLFKWRRYRRHNARRKAAA
jgi:heptose I phosphotransferase